MSEGLDIAGTDDVSEFLRAILILSHQRNGKIWDRLLVTFELLNEVSIEPVLLKGAAYLAGASCGVRVGLLRCRRRGRTWPPTLRCLTKKWRTSSGCISIGSTRRCFAYWDILAKSGVGVPRPHANRAFTNALRFTTMTSREALRNPLPVSYQHRMEWFREHLVSPYMVGALLRPPGRGVSISETALLGEAKSM